MIDDLRLQLQKGRAIRFRVKIIPKSKKNELTGMYGEDMIKIKIAAVPEKNRANEELIHFLAGLFGVQKTKVEITAGMTSHIKTIVIQP